VTRFADDGKLIVTDEDGVNRKDGKKGGFSGASRMNVVSLDDVIEEVGAQKLGKKRKASEAELSGDEDNDGDDGEGAGPRPQLKGRHQMKSKAPPKRLGEEYASKKAGGDIKRKGKPDPYAYVPLNPASLNRRTRAKHHDEMNTLLKSAGTKFKGHQPKKGKH